MMKFIIFFSAMVIIFTVYAVLAYLKMKKTGNIEHKKDFYKILIVNAFFILCDGLTIKMYLDVVNNIIF